jgi:hypothetical protein
VHERQLLKCGSRVERAAAAGLHGIGCVAQRCCQDRIDFAELDPKSVLAIEVLNEICPLLLDTGSNLYLDPEAFNDRDEMLVPLRSQAVDQGIGDRLVGHDRSAAGDVVHA